MRWLVPAFLSVLAGSLSVAVCKLLSHSMLSLSAHLEVHGLSFMLMICGLTLAGIQIARAFWGLKLEKRKSDLGHGLSEVIEDDNRQYAARTPLTP